jgi:translation initiation factor 1
MSKDKVTPISWDDFIKLGNPENAPEMPEEKTSTFNPSSQHLRVHIDKKSRGGKEVTLIVGWTADEDRLKELGKFLKSKTGVGGTVKDNEIIIQGNHREKVMKLLSDLGYKNAKKAGG